MSMPAYPAYKDSGVEWLGEVPAHWRLGKIKHAATFVTGWTPPSGNDAFYGGDNLWANISDLGPKMLSDTAKRITDAAVANSDMRAAPKGSLLFSFKLSIGQVSFVGCDMFTNEAIAAFPPQDELWMPYAYYAFPFFIPRNAAENIYGAKLLNQELIRNAFIALPPPAEQAAIAAFLDRETGKIDALVEEQRRLIALLKEKRQAVISHAVTKGLNPQAPLKPSGIEWLGDIPAHWEVSKLFYGASLQSGYAFASSDFGDEGVPIVRMNNLNRGVLDLSEAVRVPESALNPSVALGEGDILWGMSGSIGETGSLGNFAVVAADDVPCQLNQRVGRFIVDRNRMDPEFLLVWIQSSAFSQQILLAVTGTAQFNVSAEQVQGTIAARPPLSEQRDIAAHASLLMSRFDKLVVEAQCGIALLQERRAALISAAVTGKIDVRGLAATQGALEAA